MVQCDTCERWSVILEKRVMVFGWVPIFLNFVRRPGTTRDEGPHGGATHRTCGGPTEIGLAATHVLLNGSGQVPHALRGCAQA